MNLIAWGRALRRGWIWVVLILAAAVAGGWIATASMTAQYTAETRLLYSLPATGSLQDQLQASNLAAQRAATDAQLVLTPTVLDPVLEAVGDPDLTAVDLAEVVTSTAVETVVDVTVTLPDAAEATEIATGIIAQLQARAASETIVVDPTDADAPTFSFSVSPIVPPVEPADPSSPSLLLNMLIAFAVGVIAAATYLALSVARDDRIHAPEDAVDVTPIPFIGTVDRAGADGTTAATTGALRAALLAREPRRWLLAPASPLDADRAASALGRALAAIGLRPLLVSTTGGGGRPGLTDYLGGSAPADVVRNVSSAGMVVVTAGQAPGGSADLLARGTTAALLARLADDTDATVVSVPPVDAAADAAILASAPGATLLLVRRGATTRAQLGRTLTLLGEAGAEITGLVWVNRGGRSAFVAPERVRATDSLPAPATASR